MRIERFAWAGSFCYNTSIMQLPFDFNPNRYTFAGILIGILLVAFARACFGF